MVIINDYVLKHGTNGFWFFYIWFEFGWIWIIIRCQLAVRIFVWVWVEFEFEFVFEFELLPIVCMRSSFFESTNIVFQKDLKMFKLTLLKMCADWLSVSRHALKSFKVVVLYIQPLPLKTLLFCTLFFFFLLNFCLLKRNSTYMYIIIIVISIL